MTDYDPRFDREWYEDMIATHAEDDPTAHSILIGFAMLSQAIERHADAVRSVSETIMPPDSSGGHDATGGYVSSLSEAIMGITKALHEIGIQMEERP